MISQYLNSEVIRIIGFSAATLIALFVSWFWNWLKIERMLNDARNRYHQHSFNGRSRSAIS